MKNKDLKRDHQQKEQQFPKDHTRFGTAVEVNREKKVMKPNRPST